MSTYTELRGLKVKYLAANPDPGTAGDVWYDGAAFALKGLQLSKSVNDFNLKGVALRDVFNGV